MTKKKKVSLLDKFPEITKNWHYEKNASHRPEDVTPFKQKIVWWILSYNDP